MLEPVSDEAVLAPTAPEPVVEEYAVEEKPKRARKAAAEPEVE